MKNLIKKLFFPNFVDKNFHKKMIAGMMTILIAVSILGFVIISSESVYAALITGLVATLIAIFAIWWGRLMERKKIMKVLQDMVDIKDIKMGGEFIFRKEIFVVVEDREISGICGDSYAVKIFDSSTDDPATKPTVGNVEIY